MNGEMPDTIYGSLIILHLHRLTKRLVAEASPAPGPWSQARLAPVYHCCLSDTGI